jgi:hypothetical protein
MGSTPPAKAEGKGKVQTTNRFLFTTKKMIYFVSFVVSESLATKVVVGMLIDLAGASYSVGRASFGHAVGSGEVDQSAFDQPGAPQRRSGSAMSLDF